MKKCDNSNDLKNRYTIVMETSEKTVDANIFYNLLIEGIINMLDNKDMEGLLYE